MDPEISSDSPVSCRRGPSPEEHCPMHTMRNRRKYALLLIFTIAQFMDVASNSMLLPAIPRISEDLNLAGSQSSWLFAAYQSTFAAFLLVSGRTSDIYTPKPVFIGGNLMLGGMALIAGFVHNKIGLLVLRALSGIGAAFTIPAAYNMLIRLFPEPKEQGRAIGVFGIAGALGNVGGLVIGGILVQWTTFHWIFWLIAIITIPIAIGCVFFIPGLKSPPTLPGEKTKLRRLDLGGVAILTIAIILFIFAVTQGANVGWGTAGVITPLIISVIMIVLFFLWQRRVSEGVASLPPKMWFYPNFSILFAVSLLPYWWWGSVLFLFTSLWQEMYGYSAIIAAVRFLPVGIAAGFIPPIISKLATFTPAKRIILGSLTLTFIGTILLPFADQKNRYWSLVFPGFIIGTIGTMGVYIINSIAFFQTTPHEVAGTVGAVFNAALQLGSALGIAISESIQTSIDNQHPGKQHGYAGRSAAFWFLLAIVVVEMIATAIFCKSVRPGRRDEEAVGIVPAKEGEEISREKQADKSMSSSDHSSEETRAVESVQ